MRRRQNRTGGFPHLQKKPKRTHIPPVRIARSGRKGYFCPENLNPPRERLADARRGGRTDCRRAGTRRGACTRQAGIALPERGAFHAGTSILKNHLQRMKNFDLPRRRRVWAVADAALGGIVVNVKRTDIRRSVEVCVE